MERHYTYAVQIQPHNGQELTEYALGIDLDVARQWNDDDRKRFPQADRQCGEGFSLVVTRDGNVFCVATDVNKMVQPLGNPE